MNESMTPLLGIRIEHSETRALRDGQQFDTIQDFDAALRSARRQMPSGRVAFVLTWKDRGNFHGRCDLELGETVGEHVVRICSDVLTDPRRSCLCPGALLTMTRLWQAKAVERGNPAAQSAWVEDRGGTEYGDLSMSELRYTTEGPLRGRCGHKHKDIESAVDCLDSDEAVCVARGGHTDRQIFVVGRGVKRELDEHERAAIDVYRAAVRRT
jgi:hypothetical protein